MPLVLVQRMSLGTRAVLGVAGLFPLLAPYALGRGLWPPSMATPIFAIIIAGALSLSGVLLFAAIANPEETWTIDMRGLRIERRAILGYKRVWQIAPSAMRSASVHRDDGSDGDPTYEILVIEGPRRWRYPVGPNEAEARAVLSDIFSALDP